MPLWNFNVTHKNQTTATASVTLNGPGTGKAVTIPNLACSCGFSHTLVGTQTGANAMSGSGANSVAPANDPRAKPSIKADDEPSWSGSPGSMIPKKRAKPKTRAKKSLKKSVKKSAKATKSSKAAKSSKAKKSSKGKK